MGAGDGDDVRKLRVDLDEAMRFVHTMEMQTKAVVRDTTLKVTALIQELLGAGVVDKDQLTQRVMELGPVAAERDGQLHHVRLGDNVDKYAVAPLPDIPCAELIHLCKARCCTLTVFLSFQDLDERVLHWDYGAPYTLRRGRDGYCVHCQPETRACGAYAQRPTVCRSYDCRKDERIWRDYEKRIPAADVDADPEDPSRP